jgi:leader peptidase (prepilin peptidase) / N-methyltransferase
MPVVPLVLVVGLIFGSFLNVVITRLPIGEPVWAGRSRCPHCGTPIPWHDNVPLLSYWYLGGSCRSCRGAIGWRYPAVELLGGLLALGLWLRFPWDPVLWAYTPFAFALLALSVIDLEHGLLPDALTLPGTVLGLALGPLFAHLTWLEAVLGAAGGGAVLALVAWVYEKLAGRRGMGGGDVKLMALIGAFLGIEAVPWVIFVSAAAGSLVGLAWVWRKGRSRDGAWRDLPLPYGPFLAGAALLYLLGARAWWPPGPF